MFLDKKSLAFIIVASAAIITLVFFLNKEKNGASFTYSDSEIVVDSGKSSDSFKDSDEDGLKDWEEALWGTDPSEKDTDKDGVSDFEQIKKENQTENNSAKNAGNQKELTQTDILARNLFSKYASLKQVGLSGDQDSIQNAAQAVAGSALVSEYVPYKESIIKISSDNSTEAIRAYGNNISSIIIKNAPKSESETVLVKEALEKGDAKILLKLDVVIEGYQKILNGLINTPVTNELASAHLSLINSVNKLLYINESFKKSFSDPTYAFQGLAMYQGAFIEMSQSYEGIKSILKNKNITYTEDEYGSFLNKE